MPAPCTIRKWYAKSNANGNPGLSKESLDTLRNLVNEYKAKGEEVYCSLSFDEMNIKRNLTYSDTQKRFIGHISYGSIPSNAEYLPVATYALVFMINGLNIKFNLPVAYHFVNSLLAHEKASLISIVLRAVSEVGVKVIAMNFDGLATNGPSCELLGANLNIDAGFQPHILDPLDNHKIFIFFDAPHMIKLIRNCLGTYKTLYHENGSKIEWTFFEKLADLRTKCDIVTHKLTKKHIMFEKDIMKVSLAVQTFSQSVARSMVKLAEYPQTQSMFENSAETARFAKRMDNLFNVFNSDTGSNKSIFHKPINPETKDQIFSFLDETAKYIRGLKLSPESNSIIYSRRKTGFIGFLVNIHNIKEMYLEYVESGKLKEIPAQNFDQDALENLFCLVRTCFLGANDNPTVEQFYSAYRRALIATELTCSAFANCADKISILCVSSTPKQKQIVKPTIVLNEMHESNNGTRLTANESSIKEVSNLLKQNSFDGSDMNSFDGSDLTVCHLANSIEIKIKNVARTNCSTCLDIISSIFQNNEKSSIRHVPNANDRIPCKSTVKICALANQYLLREANKIGFNYNHLVSSVENELNVDMLYEATDFSHNLDHKVDLIRYIIGEMVRERANFIARKVTLNEQKKLLRRKNLKATHFAGL